jgi:hypothetical protein
VIESSLNSTVFLQEFTASNLVAAELIRPIGENLVILAPTTHQVPDSSSSSTTTKIAIAGAVTCFFLTGIFFYGWYRSHMAELKAARSPNKPHMAKRRRHFEQLQKDHKRIGDGWMTTDPMQVHNEPSITWSVSDLTSDSQSIKSSMRMDRIDEEAPFDEKDDHSDHDSEVASSVSTISTTVEDSVDDQCANHLSFIARWNDASDGSELATRGEDTARTSKTSATVTVWEVPAWPRPFWGEEDDEEALTPVRRNRIEDYDATTGDQSTMLGGGQFLDSSMDESGTDLDASHQTEPTAVSDDIIYPETELGTPNRMDQRDESYSEFGTPADRVILSNCFVHETSTSESIDKSSTLEPTFDQELRRCPDDSIRQVIDEAFVLWFHDLCHTLTRAVVQKRLTQE